MDHENYHSHQVRRQKWVDIGRQFGISEMKAKKRFKSIRDEYRKESKRLLMGIQLSDKRMEWMESLSYLKNLRPRSRRPEFHMELMQFQEQSSNGDDQIKIKDEPAFEDENNSNMNNGEDKFENGESLSENGNDIDEEFPQFLPSLPPPPTDEDMDCSYNSQNPLVPITILEHSPSPSPTPVVQGAKSIPKIKTARSVPPLSLPEVSITIESPKQNGSAPPPHNNMPSKSLLSTLKLTPKPLSALQPILPKPSPPPLIPSQQKKIPLQPKTNLINNTSTFPSSPLIGALASGMNFTSMSGNQSTSTPKIHSTSTPKPMNTRTVESNEKVTLGAFIDHMLEQEPDETRERFHLEILDALVKTKRKFMEQRFSSGNTK